MLSRNILISFFLFEIVRDRTVQYSVQLTHPPPNITDVAGFLNLARFSPSLCIICCVHGEQSSVGRMGTFPAIN